MKRLLIPSLQTRDNRGDFGFEKMGSVWKILVDMAEILDFLVENRDLYKKLISRRFESA